LTPASSEVGPELVRAAVLTFTGRPPHLACKHVVDGAGAVLCGQHPAGGLLCPRCVQRHVRRHDATEELTCDGCRAVAGELHAGVAPVSLAGGRIRDTAGRHRLFAGRLVVTGFGLCPLCHAASGGQVVDIPAALLAKGWRPA
jgi:hypothetical protein